MAESVVSGVVTKIGDLIGQEGKFLSGVSKQVELLQTELNLIQGLLKDADAKQNESEAVRRWVAEIRDLAYDADDIIATYALTVGSRKGGGLQKLIEFLCACIFLCEGITVHKVGSKIEDIMKKVSILRTNFREYGIRESMIEGGGSSSLNGPQPEQRKTYSYLDHDVVGFDDDLDELVEILRKEGEGNIRVSSICGMGGLGKTTLARMVYNDPRVKQYFNGGSAWVCISQQCQKRPVWEEIMINFLPKEKSQNDRKEEIKGWSDGYLISKLREVQQNEKCLVVLDDIWKIEDWNILCHVFPVKDTKSKILLTSRISDVALHADPRGIHNLEGLNPEKSLELLEKMAISWRSDSETKNYMKKLGEEMIEYCGGLPLAITALGGLLATKQTREEWEDVHKHVKSYLHEEQNLRVNKVLALSYNDLPSHLKLCFLYLGHFPEDFVISTKKLIRMWMGEGFISQIQHRGGREETMDDVGDRYLRELVQRCMVLVVKKDPLGRIKTCQMHDLMRDFCVSKVQEENFLHFTNTLSMKQHEAQIGKVRRLAIISESGDNSIKGIKFSEYPCLRSLLYLLPRSNESIFKESCFNKFKLVRVLHLEYFKQHLNKLPKDTGCLIHLRYLSLRGSYIEDVPSSIGNLRCLETLDLRFEVHGASSALSDYLLKPKVPNVFKYMKQLKHLYLPIFYRVCCKLELANLSYLQTLVNVQPKTIQMPTWFKLNRLRVLYVLKYKGLVRVQVQVQVQDAIKILVSCPHIEKLGLDHLIKKLPEAHQFSPNLAKLTLRATGLEEDPMPTLEQLPNLKFLRLFHDSCLVMAFSGKDMVCSKGGFPLLQYLVLCHLRELEEWRVDKGAMPSLCHLTIDRCYNLKTIPDGLRFVTTLQELKISLMPKSFKDRLQEGGPDFDKVKHVPSLVFEYCDMNDDEVRSFMVYK